MTRQPIGDQLVGAAYALAMLGVAVWAAWPIYDAPAFGALAGASVVAGLGLARIPMPPLVRGTAAVAALVGLGLALAVPTAQLGVGRALAELGSGMVFGWKDLLTVGLPVGGYRNLLTPALVVFLFAALAAGRLLWREAGPSDLAAPVLLAAQLFGLAFGSDAGASPTSLAGLTLAAPRDIAHGGAAALLSVAWLGWRARQERARMLARAAGASGVSLGRRGRGWASAGVAAVGMLAVSLAAGSALAPVVAGERPRLVLRSGAVVELNPADQTSPLSVYRSFFDDDSFDKVLFTVHADGRAPQRVRLAVLPHYDGETYGFAEGDQARFARVPAALDAGPGERSELKFETGQLGSIWTPMAGSLASVEFSGPRAEELGGGFYFDSSTGAAIETVPGGLAEGDSYTAVVAPDQTSDPATLSPPGVVSQVAPPDSLIRWMDRQGLPADGAGLVELASRLRASGYLSHDVATPETPVPGWALALGPEYVFVSSLAGHSLSRIDQLFTELAEHEAGDGGGVGAVGDDEQFAVAIALMAERAGFPARVVVGARLTGSASDGVPPCEQGVCRGRNVAVWVEVVGADGRVGVLDATPQHVRELDQLPQRQRDPRRPTRVLPLVAEPLDPPPPDQNDARARRSPEPPPAPARAWRLGRGQMAALTLGGVALLASPLLGIWARKGLRRRSRRRSGSPARRVTSGWRELADFHLDLTRMRHGPATRLEQAAALGTRAAKSLARAADEAVFSAQAVTDEEARGCWDLVDEERARLAHSSSAFARVRAAISIASLRVRRGRGKEL